MHQHRVALNCTDVSPICPVQDTIYGYSPSLPLNALFVAIFALCALLQIILGIRAKTYFFCYVLVLGCTGEAIGYAGRIIMHSNPVSYFPLPNPNQLRMCFLHCLTNLWLTIFLVFLSRLQNPNLLPDFLSRIHRSRYLPHTETPRSCLRTRKKQNSSSILHLDLHHLRLHLSDAPSCRWRSCWWRRIKRGVEKQRDRLDDCRDCVAGR